MPRTIPRPSTTGLLAFSASVLLPLLATASGLQGQTQNPAMLTVVLPPGERHDASPATSAPLPEGIRGVAPPRPVDPPLPIGRGTLPQPQDEETVPSTPGPTGGCGALLYETGSLPPARLSPVVSPSVAQVQDTILMTGNPYAARSIDQGQTWTMIDPDTTFPSMDGGFCCNQRVLYVPSEDIVVWVLQYAPSSQTGSNGIRVAVANGRADLRAGTAGAWHSWYWRANTFGFSGSGYRLDFPDLAHSDTQLHLTADVLDTSSRVIGSFFARLSLQELAANALTSIGYGSTQSGHITGRSHRLAQGATDTAYFASHVDNTTLRLFSKPDTGSFTSVDITVPAWTSGPYVALAPNGVNWGARHESRILGGYQNATEVGFMWVSAPQTGRPQCFVRTARIRKSDKTLISTQDTYSNTYQFLYPAATTNQRGDIGCAVAFASSSAHPTTAFFVVDACNPGFGGQTVHGTPAGNSPSRPEWGDSLSLQRHPYYWQSFVGCGQRLLLAGTDNLSRDYAWFGKDSEAPVPVTLTVEAANVSGAPVPFTLDATDRNGLRNGATPATRSFYRRQGYSLTVPASVAAGGVSYGFLRWSLYATSGALIREQLDTTLTVDSIASSGDRAVAVYRQVTRLAVVSANPASGVTVTCSPADLDGRTSAVTPGELRYLITNGLFRSVTLTAPPFNSSGVPFKRWVFDNSPATQNPYNAMLTGTYHTVSAEYYTRVIGSVQEFGVGCPGTNNVVPRHTSGSSTPRVGESFPFDLSMARPNAVAVLFLSRSNSNWLGIPLPLQLGFFGMGTCTLYAAGDVQLGAATGFTGAGSVPFLIPDDPALIATHLYSQFVVFDPGTATPLQLVLSNALDLFVGGDV